MDVVKRPVPTIKTPDNSLICATRGRGDVREARFTAGQGIPVRRLGFCVETRHYHMHVAIIAL